jgi:hypothetical protein
MISSSSISFQSPSGKLFFAFAGIYREFSRIRSPSVTFLPLPPEKQPKKARPDVRTELFSFLLFSSL